MTPAGKTDSLLAQAAAMCYRLRPCGDLLVCEALVDVNEDFERRVQENKSSLLLRLRQIRALAGQICRDEFVKVIDGRPYASAPEMRDELLAQIRLNPFDNVCQTAAWLLSRVQISETNNQHEQ